MQTFTTHQGIAPKVKIGHSKEAKVQRIYCIKRWRGSIRLKFNCSTSAICARDIRQNFSSNRRRCIHSNKMDGSWQRQLSTWLTRCSRIKGDNKKKKLGEIRVMQITVEPMGLRWMVWAFSRTRLTLMVQRSTQHHQSTVSRLTHQNRLTAKRSTVQPLNHGCTK